MSDPTDPPVPPELGYRSRGRPRLPDDQKRREKLVVALNAEEYRVILHAAADSDGGPARVQDWARRVLLAAARSKG